MLTNYPQQPARRSLRRALAVVALLCIPQAFAQDARTLNEQGKTALASGDLQAALAKFRNAAQLTPQNPQIQFNIGLATLRLGQPKQALPALRLALADPTLAPEAHYLLGAAYFESGDYSEVATQLNDLRDSSHAEHVLFLLEESYRLTGKVSEAQQTFHQLNSRFSDSPWVHYLMGAVFESQADHEKAIAEYQAALAKNPKLPNANFAIGYIYWQDKAFEKAKPWLNQELSVQPCHALACYYLAETARTNRDLAAAAALYRRSIACEDRNAKTHLGLGIALTALHRNDEAVAEFRRAIDLDPADAAAHYRLALLYRTLGRKADADAEYERVKKIHARGQTEAVEGLKTKP
jgi:tetratricopeptide (TPR) repeat protein